MWGQWRSLGVGSRTSASTRRWARQATLPRLCLTRLKEPGRQCLSRRRILRYVASTLDKGIIYTQPDGSNPQLSIQGWSDAALGECMDTRKSRLGALVIVNGAFVTGKSARLKRVVTSSTGAEVYALSAAAREMVAVRNQLRELQHPIEAI